MPESRGVWGIEIGQAGLKAIRLRYAEAAKQVIAVAFDYVPHPKILSQPDAIPEELVPKALETFLSRNSIAGDKVCIGVPGQSALTRFIQLPPVESNRVAEIVKYEARQQIPFDLEDVIWDYQRVGGGMEESGFLLEAEVGLFAMKKEQVHAALQPFVDQKVEVDVIQVAPLALYNMLSYDQLGIRIEEEGQIPDGEDEHTIVVDMGADNSTLLVSNGEKIWIRNVPVGGNHFTRALTKEMKLTFAKAEHLKCNATKAPDPRAVFQALRPVFNDYVSEIQRSIGYFSSVNREASIKRVLGVGNGFKLAGLQKFLQQNLQYEVERIDTFKGLVGDNVLGDPVFQENVLGFAVPYGMALQALGVTPIHTSLLPPEITRARAIRKKKPWAVATAATLLFGLATSVAVGAGALMSVENEDWEKAKKAALDLKGAVDADRTAYNKATEESKQIDQKIGRLVEPFEDRFKWPELYKAVYDCMPHTPPGVVEEQGVEKLSEQERMKLVSLRAVEVPDLAKWWDARVNDPQSSTLGKAPADIANPPSGPGYVVELKGQHYHHVPEKQNDVGVQYVITRLLANLHQWEVKNPNTNLMTPVRDAGISHAFVVSFVTPQEVRILKNQDEGGDVAARARAAVAAEAANRDTLEDELYVTLRETSFVVEFAWQPFTRTERLKFTALRPLFAQSQNAAAVTLPEAQAVLTNSTNLEVRGLGLTTEELERFKAWYAAGQVPATPTGTTN